MAIKMPVTAEKYTNKEKSLFALSLFPSPIVFDTNALPPVPNIKPIAPKIIRKGIIKFTAAKDVLPTKFDTKYPSTTP